MFGFSIAPSVKASGRRNFVWKWGVLSFGIPGAVLGTIVKHWIEPASPASGVDWLFVVEMIVSVPIGAVAGYLWGRAMWYLGTHE